MINAAVFLEGDRSDHPYNVCGSKAYIYNPN